MFIIAGKKLCGRVDQVPAKCYVKTRFIHFYYVPVVPLSSWVIEQGTEKPTGFRGQQIPLSWKSVIFGWLQSGLVILGSYNAFMGGVLILDHRHIPNNEMNSLFKLVLGVMCLVAWMLFTIWPYPATDKRAKELTERLGLPYDSNKESFYSEGD